MSRSLPGRLKNPDRKSPLTPEILQAAHDAYNPSDIIVAFDLETYEDL